MADVAFSSGHVQGILDLINVPNMQDLDALPPQHILFQLLDLYFEKVACMKSILHPQKFKSDITSYANYTPPDMSRMPEFMRCMVGPPISPALILSILACAAAYHPIYESEPALIRSTFYERARRLALSQAESMNLASLKTGIMI